MFMASCHHLCRNIKISRAPLHASTQSPCGGSVDFAGMSAGVCSKCSLKTSMQPTRCVTTTSRPTWGCRASSAGLRTPYWPVAFESYPLPAIGAANPAQRCNRLSTACAKSAGASWGTLCPTPSRIDRRAEPVNLIRACCSL